MRPKNLTQATDHDLILITNIFTLQLLTIGLSLRATLRKWPK
jgi:hypothetical protein